MFFFLQAIWCYEVDPSLLDTEVYIKPSRGDGARLCLQGMEAMLTKTGMPMKIRKVGDKKYHMYSGAARMCHKEEKDMVGDCSMGSNASEVWNIKKKHGTEFYSIKSGKEGFFKQYCLTHKKSLIGPVSLDKCESDRDKQLFRIENLSAPKQLPKPNLPTDKNESSSSSQEDIPVDRLLSPNKCGSSSRSLCGIKDQIDYAASKKQPCPPPMNRSPAYWQQPNGMQPMRMAAGIPVCNQICNQRF